MLVDDIELGGFNLEGNSISSIFPNRLLLPEYIEVSKDGDAITYRGKTNMEFHFAAYQEKFPTSGVVELIVEVEKPHEDSIISRGRRAISPILTILDFSYGERLLGALITEEVVEIFPDDHWNRKIISPSVGSESQLDMIKIENAQIEQMKKSIEIYNNFRKGEAKKISLASDWFWKSEREVDSINKFIQLWVCIEALEMSTTDIKPVAEQLAHITSQDYFFWKEPGGRLFGKRSELIHGNASEVKEHETIILRGIAKILLTNKLGKTENPELVQEIISFVDVHFNNK